MTNTHTPGPNRFTKYRGADGRDGYAILSSNPEVGRGYGVVWIEEGQFPNAEHDGPLFSAAADLLSAADAIAKALFVNGAPFNVEYALTQVEEATISANLLLDLVSAVKAARQIAGDYEPVPAPAKAAA
ncbi:Phage protein [Azospirillum argentinense]|uniref:hypothetical protein n=1 Tax=Azospirillum argentinense TaxID=2970906 RepID=UPI0032DFD65F